MSDRATMVDAETDEVARHLDLTRIDDEIEASRTLLDLHDDWDGEGSLGYDQPTWSRATRFLRANAELVGRQSGSSIPPPAISPGPDGGIDLHWRTSDRELLIHVPADDGRPARFYGDDGAQGTPIEGELDPREPGSWLLMWLIRQ